ncbi:MAG: hypothetical protein L0Y75_08235 [Acidobacteria bacterium]|nr:hypothetical protein [Acidobacteriota bacterium]
MKSNDIFAFKEFRKWGDQKDRWSVFLLFYPLPFVLKSRLMVNCRRFITTLNNRKGNMDEYMGHDRFRSIAFTGAICATGESTHAQIIAGRVDGSAAGRRS